VREEASIIGDMAADLMQILSTAGFLIALAVIGLSLFTLSDARSPRGGHSRRLCPVRRRSTWQLLERLGVLLDCLLLRNEAEPHVGEHVCARHDPPARR
jgi:hypothetical protein